MLVSGRGGARSSSRAAKVALMKMKLHAVGESSTPLVNGLSIIIISYSALPCVLLAYQIRALLMSNRDVRYDTTVIGIPENTRGNIDTSALPKS